jgi:hypothetical protein
MDRELDTLRLELERRAAVVNENLTLARLALENAREARSTGRDYEALYSLRDAFFHAHRCLDQREQLESHTPEATRRLDRDENRRDVLSG